MATTYYTTLNAADHSGAKCDSTTFNASPKYVECSTSGPSANATFSVTLAAAATNTVAVLESAAGVGAVTWPAGTWTVPFTNTSGTADLDVIAAYVCRVNSSGTNLSTVASNTSVGIDLAVNETKTITITQGSSDNGGGSGSSDDRFYIQIVVQNSHAKQPRDFTGSFDQDLTIPYTAATPTTVTVSTTEAVTVTKYDATVTINPVAYATTGALTVTGYDATVNRLLDERFEGTGYEESWAETKDGAATINPDAAVALAGSPSGWGSQCCEFVAGSAENCYILWDYGSNPAKTFYATAEFCLTAEGMGNSQSAVIIRIWSGDTILAVTMSQDALGARYLRFNCKYDGSTHNIDVYDLELNKVYRVDLAWNLEAATFAYYLNGHVIGSGTISGTALTWGCRYVRVGRLAGGFTTTIYFDRVLIDSNAIPGPEGGGIQFIPASTGAATATGYAADVTIQVTTTVSATKGAVTVTGYDATVTKPFVIGCTVGSVTVTGYDATVTKAFKIAATSDAVTVTGYDVTVTKPFVINCTAGVVTVTGYDASIPMETDIDVTAGAVTVTGYDVTVTKPFVITATKGAVTVTGYDVTVTKPFMIAAAASAVTVTGYDATIVAPVMVQATAGEVTITGYDAGVGILATYYIANGGTAANPESATGVAYPDNFMDLAEHNSNTYAPGDSFIIDGQHGVIRCNDDAALYPKTSGTQALPITYTGINNATLSAADLIGDSWVDASGEGTNLWYVARTTAPLQVFMDDVRGNEESIQGDVNAEYDWWWDSSNSRVYIYCTQDPYDEYTTRGVEITDGDSVVNCCTWAAGDKDWQVFDNIQFEKAREFSFNCYNKNIDGLEVKNCTFKNSYYAGSRVYGDESGDGMTNVYFHDNTAEYNGGHGTVFGGKMDGTIQRRDHARYNGHYESQPGAAGSQTFTAGLKITGYYNINFLLEHCIAEYQNTTHASPVASKGNGIWTDVHHWAMDTEAYGTVIRYNISRFNQNQGIRLEITKYAKCYANLVYDNLTFGIVVACNPTAGDGYKYSHYNKVYNNTVYGGTRALQCTGGSIADGAVGNEFKNNIGAGFQYRFLYAYGGGENDGTNGYDNVYESNCGVEAANFITWGGSSYSTWDTWLAASSQADNNVESDPQLKAVGSDKYYLTSGSPCIDSGTNLGATYDDCLDPRSGAAAWANGAVATLDQDDWGSGWDVGAYVYDGLSAAGAVTVTGYNPTVEVGTGTTVATAKGTVTVTGYDATVTAHTSFTASAGAVTVAGLDPAITIATLVSAGTGAVTATALDATLHLSTRVLPASGAVTVAAHNATITTAETVLATKGAVTVTGYDTSVAAVTGVQATLGAVTVTGYAATVSIAAVTTIDATLGTVTVASVTPAFAMKDWKRTKVSSGSGVVTVLGKAAAVIGPVVAATLGTVAITAHAASIHQAKIDVACTKGAVTVSGHNVNPHIVGVEIPVTLGTVTVTGYNAAGLIAAQVYAKPGEVVVSGHDTVISTGDSLVFWVKRGSVTVAGANPAVVAPLTDADKIAPTLSSRNYITVYQDWAHFLPAPMARRWRQFLRDTFYIATPLVAVSGTANSIELTTDDEITQYIEGDAWRFIATETNTGGTIVDINNIGPQTLLYNDQPLRGGEIVAGGACEIIYEGNAFKLVSSSRSVVGSAGRVYMESQTISHANAEPLVWTSVPNYDDAGYFQPVGSDIEYILIPANGRYRIHGNVLISTKDYGSGTLTRTIVQLSINGATAEASEFFNSSNTYGCNTAFDYTAVLNTGDTIVVECYQQNSNSSVADILGSTVSIASNVHDASWLAIERLR